MIEKFDGKYFHDPFILQQYNSDFWPYEICNIGTECGYKIKNIAPNFVSCEKIFFLKGYKDIYFNNLNNIYFVFFRDL